MEHKLNHEKHGKALNIFFSSREEAESQIDENGMLSDDVLELAERLWLEEDFGIEVNDNILTLYEDGLQK